MIIKDRIIMDLEIKSLHDLPKLKMIMDNSNIKVNKAQLAREMNVDVRTVSKYLDGYEKPPHRFKISRVDKYRDIIKELLESKTQRFYYIRNLYSYLKDNHGLDVAENTFRDYINKNSEFRVYFNKTGFKVASSKPVMRFETPKGKQCQLDWKESIDFVLSDTGEQVEVNVFVLMMSYSRNRIYRLSLKKTQDVLFHFLTEAFEELGGVPHEMVTDNMSTVMDEARTAYHEGKINSKFHNFANDFGFTVKPCIAASPQTKAKVESPMRVLDEIRAYSGLLTYVELNEFVAKLNSRYNTKVNAGTGKIPANEFEKEKSFLHQLPNMNIRNSYRIKTNTVKVNSSSMISVSGNSYSVPPELTGKEVTYQIIDSNIYVYHNKSLKAVHKLSDKKVNINTEHYRSIVSLNFPNLNEDEVEKIAKSNLEVIGEIYE